MLPTAFLPYSTLHSLLVKVKIRAIAGLIHTVSKLPGLVNNAALTEEKKEPKRYSVVDTQGALVHGTVDNANHSRGGCNIVQEVRQDYPTLKNGFVDAGYEKPMLAFVRNDLKKTIEISEPQDGLDFPKDGFLNEPWLGSSIIQDCLKRTKWL